jgi:hypothetical protein
MLRNGGKRIVPECGCERNRLDGSLRPQAPHGLHRTIGLVSDQRERCFTAHAPLAATHTDPRQRLQTIDLLGLTGAHAASQRSCVDLLATAHDRVIRPRCGSAKRRWERGFQSRAKDGDPLHCTIERCRFFTMRIGRGFALQVLEYRERRAPAGKFRGIGSGYPRTVAREIDPRNGTASCRVALGQPALRGVVEAEAATRNVGQLGFGTQAEAERECIAPDCFDDSLVAVPGISATPCETRDGPFSVHALQRHVAFDPHAVGLEPADVVDALGQRGWLASELRQRSSLRGERARIEHGGDARTSFRILVCDEVKERPCTGEYDLRADRATLRLERCLRTAERIDARQRPSGYRQDTIGRACCEDQVGERHVLLACIMQRHEPAALSIARLAVPDQRIGLIADMGEQRLHRRMERMGFGCLESVERTLRAFETGTGGRLPIDLPAATRLLVEHERTQSRCDERFGRPHARGTRADDDNARSVGHRSPPHVVPSPDAAARSPSQFVPLALARVTRRIPATIGVEHARMRPPASVCSQQSWHAPMRQKPARGSSLNSLWRTNRCSKSTAVSTVSPASACASRPSRKKETLARRVSAIRTNCGSLGWQASACRSGVPSINDCRSGRG